MLHSYVKKLRICCNAHLIANSNSKIWIQCCQRRRHWLMPFRNIKQTVRTCRSPLPLSLLCSSDALSASNPNSVCRIASVFYRSCVRRICCGVNGGEHCSLIESAGFLWSGLCEQDSIRADWYRWIKRACQNLVRRLAKCRERIKQQKEIDERRCHRTSALPCLRT